MSAAHIENDGFRQRLVLVARFDRVPDAGLLRAALSGGDVASVILVQGAAGEAAFANWTGDLVPVAQETGAAAIVAGDSRAAGRAQADGIHLPADIRTVREAVARAGGRTIVGADSGKTRDTALEVGEQRPDYVLFGRLDGDTHDEPHPRPLELAAWWAEFVEVPAVVMAGRDLATLDRAIDTGAEFIALGDAVFMADDPAAAVARANALIAEAGRRGAESGNAAP